MADKKPGEERYPDGEKKTKPLPDGVVGVA